MTYKVQQCLPISASPVLCCIILHFQSSHSSLLLISHICTMLPFATQKFSGCFSMCRCPSHTWMIFATFQIDLGSFSLNPGNLPDFLIQIFFPVIHAHALYFSFMALIIVTIYIWLCSRLISMCFPYWNINLLRKKAFSVFSSLLNA